MCSGRSARSICSAAPVRPASRPRFPRPTRQLASRCAPGCGRCARPQGCRRSPASPRPRRPGPRRPTTASATYATQTISSRETFGGHASAMLALTRRSRSRPSIKNRTSALSRLAEQPGSGMGNRLVLVDSDDALDDADQRPYEPPDQNRNADQYDAQQDAVCQIKQADPEGPDLELIVRSEHWVRVVDLEVSDDNADQGRDAGEKTHAVE